MNNFKPLEDWLEQAKKTGCDDYIAMAMNKEDQMCSIGSSKPESMLKMLMTIAEKNEAFRSAIMATASIMTKKLEEGKRPKFIARKGGVR